MANLDHNLVFIPETVFLVSPSRQAPNPFTICRTIDYAVGFGSDSTPIRSIPVRCTLQSFPNALHGRRARLLSLHLPSDPRRCLANSSKGPVYGDPNLFRSRARER